MSDVFDQDPQVRAEMAVCELRKVTLEIISRELWPYVVGDPSLMLDVKECIEALKNAAVKRKAA